jgi:hypothetical protein
MYRYRCAILHDGSTDLNSLDISPQKIQWFYQLAKQFLGWVQALAVESLKSDQKDLAMFWSNFIMSYLYSEINEHVDEYLAQTEKLFAFDWENNTWPEPRTARSTETKNSRLPCAESVKTTSPGVTGHCIGHRKYFAMELRGLCR